MVTKRDKSVDHRSFVVEIYEIACHGVEEIGVEDGDGENLADALDRNAPIANARHLARELPDATLHVSESSGHDVGLDRSGEIMSVLASRGR